MTKRGLSGHTEDQITQIVARHAARGVLCSTAQIHAAMYRGAYDARLSSLRVTLSWMVRKGLIRRQRHGRLPTYYPIA